MLLTTKPITYFVFQKKTVFIPLRYVYPECWLHIKDSPSLYPMKCFTEDACPPGVSCGEVLVKRVHYFFQEVVPYADLLIAYFTYPDRPKSIRASVFRPSLDIPTVSIVNPFAFRKFKKEATMFQWVPTQEYLFMGGSKGLISVDSLIQ